MFYLLGTVFQTAILVMFIVPRLRPGLLSLRSVLASSQNYPQSITNNQSPITNNLSPITDHPQPTTHNRRNKLWLEANTERSESNPGRSLGIRREVRKAVWKTVPCPKHTAPVSAALPADVS